MKLASVQVVSEIEEPFVPQPDDLLVNLHDSRAVIETFLDNLPSVFSTNLSADSALGPALQAAFMIINPLGGKMLVFQAAVPSLGKEELLFSLLCTKSYARLTVAGILSGF